MSEQHTANVAVSALDPALKSRRRRLLQELVGRELQLLSHFCLHEWHEVVAEQGSQVGKAQPHFGVQGDEDLSQEPLLSLPVVLVALDLDFEAHLVGFTDKEF